MHEGFRRPLRRAALIAWLLLMPGALSGCFIQPDRTLDPLAADLTSPQPLPYSTTVPLATAIPTPTAASAQATPQAQGDSPSWQDWGAVFQDATPTPRPASSWQTSAEDYNAGYPVLRVGSSGSDVYDLQERLQELGYYTGSLDGRYASGTQEAVVAFQTRHGLTSDGIAGRETQDKLYSANAVAAKISATTTTSGYTLLKAGVQGTEVRKLQVRLAELGYYSGGADGVFGSSTENAVKAFQRANNLTADSQAGEQTQKKLYGNSAVAASRPVATADPTATRSLKQGMEGNDVYSMQKRLIALYYLNGVADGVFGTETDAALRAFQKNNSLTVDGVAGASTLKKLESSSAKPATRVTATATPKPGTYMVLREGDAGEYVFDLQERLYDLGYYNGRIDGRFGAGTTTAVLLFQQNNSLTADGIAGGATQTRLYSNSAKINPAILSTPRPQPTATQLPPQENYTALREGSSGTEVTRLQQYLYELGYYSGRIDGSFGPGTTAAVLLFQYHNGLTQDGIAGHSTQDRIYSGNANELPASAATARPNTGETLSEGSAGDAVRQLQARLFQLRYLDETAITGTYDTATAVAVVLFQQRHGLSADGIAGPGTLEMLYSVQAETYIVYPDQVD